MSDRLSRGLQQECLSRRSTVATTVMSTKVNHIPVRSSSQITSDHAVRPHQIMPDQNRLAGRAHSQLDLVELRVAAGVEEVGVLWDSSLIQRHSLQVAVLSVRGISSMLLVLGPRKGCSLQEFCAACSALFWSIGWLVGPPT